MAGASFELTVLRPAPEDGTNVPVAEVRGEVDITNAAHLKRALADLASGGLVVDLSAVGYFDSAASEGCGCCSLRVRADPKTAQPSSTPAPPVFIAHISHGQTRT